jgi:hypothetical protein
MFKTFLVTTAAVLLASIAGQQLGLLHAAKMIQSAHPTPPAAPAVHWYLAQNDGKCMPIDQIEPRTGLVNTPDDFATLVRQQGMVLTKVPLGVGPREIVAFSTVVEGQTRVITFFTDLDKCRSFIAAGGE